MDTLPQDHDPLRYSYRLVPSDWKDADAWQFLGFMMHFHTQQCRCGARHSWTQTLRIFGHRTYIASRGHRYLPFADSTTGMPQNEPLSIVSLPDEPVLICHSCLGGYRKAGEDIIELRSAQDSQNWINALLTDAAREREARRKAQASPSKPAVPAASNDDILNIGV